MQARGFGQKPCDCLLLDGGPPCLARRILIEDGLCDEGIDGQAGGLDTRAKRLPQRGGRAIGYRCSACLFLRHASTRSRNDRHQTARKPRLPIRLRLATHLSQPPPGPGAQPCPWSMGSQRESRLLAFARSRCRPSYAKGYGGQEHRVPPPKLAERRRVVVQDTKVLAVVARGADSPLRDGSRESGSLHGRDATPNTLRSAGLGSTPKSASARLKASVGPNTPEADSQPYGCPEGGLRGTGESPQQGARGSTTHTLYSSLSGIAPHTIIVAEQRGGMEMCIHSI